jgi:hypothetical protein
MVTFSLTVGLIGSLAKWQIRGGYMEVASGTGNILSADCDFLERTVVIVQPDAL